MKHPGLSFQARQTTGLPLTHCRHPDVTARVFEEPDHDIGSKAVALRVSSCRCRPGQLFEALDATESQNARACADPPVSDAIAQEHLVPAPARRLIRQRELGADELSPANWKNRQAPPASIPITPRPVARAGSPPMECRPGHRRPWFLRAGSSPHRSRLPPRGSDGDLRPRDIALDGRDPTPPGPTFGSDIARVRPRAESPQARTMSPPRAGRFPFRGID